MPRDKKEKERAKEAPDVVPSGGATGNSTEAIDNRLGYKACCQDSPANEQQLAEKTKRLADLCQYFTAHQIDIPADIVERVAELSKLTVPERVRAVVEVNRDLMEYLNAVAEVARRLQ